MVAKKVSPSSYLGLKPLEENIVRILDGEQMSVAELARITEVPTTTLDYMLPQLQNKGWIVSKFVGKRRVWSRENRTVHLEQLNQALKTLFVDESRFGLTQKDCATMRLYEGKEEFTKLFTRLFQYKHLGAIQSTHSARVSIEKMQFSYFMNLNKQISKSKTVIDAVVPSDFYTALGKEYGSLWLKGFEGRTANTNFISDDFFDHNVDIIKTSDRVVLVNWSDERMLELNDSTFSPLFKNYFTLIQAGGKKINLTEHVQALRKKLQSP